MRVVGLAISKTLEPGIEGSNAGAYLRDLFRRCSGSKVVLVMPSVHRDVRAMLARYCPECIATPMIARLSRYKRKADAYEERAVAIATECQEMFVFYDMNDWTRGPVLIADTFSRVHPGYALVTYIVVDGEVLEVSLDEMKRRSGYK